MRFIHCETYQGSIAAAQLEFPNCELYSESDIEASTGIISPVVIDQLGDMVFLAPVATVDAAVAAAKAHIEQRNSSYIDSVLEDKMPAGNAVQHFKDCGIPLEMVPPMVIEQPYFAMYKIPQIRCLLPENASSAIAAEWIA